jgi:cytochrome c2
MNVSPRKGRAGRTIRYLFLASVAGLSLLGAGLWAGVSLSDALERRFSFPSRVEDRVNMVFNSTMRGDAPVERRIGTNRLTLLEETRFLPLEVADYAGGITTVDGETVLLLDRRGRVFHIGDEAVEQLDIEVPDNGYQALRRQAREGRFGAATVAFKRFRYNDLLFLRRRESSHLVASYSEWDPDAFCIRSTLARLDLPGEGTPQTWTAAPSDWHIVARTEPCLPPLEFGGALRGTEAAGRLLRSGDGTVLWTTGPYERDDAETGPDFSRALSQRDDSDYGRVLEVDLFTGSRREIARGLRNAQGLTMGADGRVWVTDHGMRGGDELNLVREGANFGWPEVSYGTRYDRRPAGNVNYHGDHDGYDEPAWAFVPSVAPGTVLALDGFDPVWDGDILVGGFDGYLYRVHIVEDRAAFAEPIHLDVRSRDMDALADGRIVIWTDDRRLVYLSSETRPDPVAALISASAGIERDALRRSVRATLDGCLVCHAFEEGLHGSGPSLHGICGRRPGSADFGDYSGALDRLGGVWTAGRLAAFLVDPEGVAPGTAMDGNGIASREVSEALSRLLCSG